MRRDLEYLITVKLLLFLFINQIQYLKIQKPGIQAQAIAAI